MGLNCHAGQWAWICPPRTPVDLALGLDQLQGRVVQTQRLLQLPSMGRLAPKPTWEVLPLQRVVAPGPFPPGLDMKPGDKMVLSGVPDAWLRPLPDFPPGELEQLHRELSS